MSALSPCQQPTVLFPIYQNSIWTIRCLVDKTIDPATKRRLKIVGFIFDAIERTEKCSRKKNIKSFLTRGSLRMQAVKLATTADISLSLPICLRGTFQYVTFMHYSLATFFLFMQSIILKCPDCKTKPCIKFLTCIFSEAYISDK